DGHGGALGELHVPALPTAEPLWAVVSTEPDLRSPSLVGWPIAPADGADPRTTFDVPDVLLLDTAGAAVERESARVHRARLVSSCFVALVLAVTALFVVRGAHRARSGLEAHLFATG